MSRKNKNKNKKKKPQITKEKIIVQQNQDGGLPFIVGADFNAETNDINKIQEQIDSLPKSDLKKRVLVLSEGSYLNTGFSKYARQILKRLHATGKYIVGEMGSYSAPRDQDPRAAQIPWEYFHNCPQNAIEGQEYGMWGGQALNSNYELN